MGAELLMNEITNETQLDTVLAEDVSVVDFWASWCGPCRALAPTFESLSKQYPNVSFAKVNVDEQVGLANKYAVRSIPTVVVFKKGVETARIIGFQDEQKYKEAIEG